METDPKRTNVKAVLVDGYRDDLPPGASMYWKEAHRLQFACPGCGQFGGIRIGHPKPAESPSWDIVTGSPEDPTTLTVSPSIHCVGCCGWHGHLKNGVFVSC